MENKRLFGELTPRLKAFREKVLDAKPYIDAERAVLCTEAYQANKNQPPVMKRALMLKNILEKMTIYIENETMIVGDSLTSDIRGGDNAGIVTCWYNPEGIKAPEGYRIDHEIRDLHEVYSLL